MTDAFDRATERTQNEKRDRRLALIRGINRKGFRIHATVFVAVQVLLVLIWALQWQLGGTVHPWFLYVLVGWGIGLAIHYAVIRDGSRLDRHLRKVSSRCR